VKTSFHNLRRTWLSGVSLVVSVAALILALLAPPAMGMSNEFFGLNADDALWVGDQPTYDAITTTGVGTLRQGFDRSVIEPTPGRYDFSLYDRYVSEATTHRFQLVPVLIQNYAAPVVPADFAGFVAAVVRRYGAGGSFWVEHPEVEARPLRDWQVWNEPNNASFWAGRPDPRAYARLLRSSAAAIRAVDPGARVLTAGIATRTPRPWRRYLRGVLRAAPRVADAVAVHPYAETPRKVLAKVRIAAKTARVPLLVTELGWATDGSPDSMVVGRRQQANRLKRTLRLLASERRALRLEGVDVYDLRDLGAGSHWGNWAGLLSRDGQPKPSYWALRQTVDDLT
jgi:hypothetical protein